MTSILWNENSSRGEGLKQKCPPWGKRGGRYGCFLELHNISFIYTVDQPLKAPTIASDTTADDGRDVNKLTTKFGSSLTSEGKNLKFLTFLWRKCQLTWELYKCACLIVFRNFLLPLVNRSFLLIMMTMRLLQVVDFFFRAQPILTQYPKTWYSRKRKVLPPLGGGRGTHSMFIRGGSAWRSNPLSF